MSSGQAHLNQLPETRLEERRQLAKKYPSRIPVIFIRVNTNSNTPELLKERYLVPFDMTFDQLRRTLKYKTIDNDKPDQRAKYYFVKRGLFSSVLIPGQLTMIQLENEYANKQDQTLYIVYGGENAFGYI